MCRYTKHQSIYFNDTATTEIYTLSLHDALPICSLHHDLPQVARPDAVARLGGEREDELLGAQGAQRRRGERSEEHTSELQSRPHIVCRLLLGNKRRSDLHSPRACI